METKNKEIKDLDIPEVIYKYRDWTDDKHKTILTKRQVFLASPGTFEDALDCKIPIRYDLITKNEIFDKYMADSQIENPELYRNKHRKIARDLTKKSPFKNPEKVKKLQETYFKEFFERVGVLSLTAEHENDKMWTEYADNFKGFCIGFDTAKMFQYLGGGGEVNYCDELPIIFPEPKHSFFEQCFYQIFSKEKKWEFEKEFRPHKFSDTPLNNIDRTVTLPPQCYNSIILGKDMPDDIKEQLRNAIPEELAHVLIIEK